jgi:hypothetical protein
MLFAAIGYQAASHGANIAVIGNGTTASIDPGADGVTTLGSASFRYSEANAKSFNALADAAAAAEVEFVADAGADNEDSWRVQAADSGALTISSFATGSYAEIVSAENTGTVTIAGDLVSNSDLRLKENVRGNAVPNVSQIFLHEGPQEIQSVPVVGLTKDRGAYPADELQAHFRGSVEFKVKFLGEHPTGFGGSFGAFC